jgi:phosphate transport system substrate-binding protein
VSLADLDAIFGAEHKRAAANLRLWGELGLRGEWKTRPIHVLGPKLDSIPALYFRRRVMQDSRKWNPDYREFASSSVTMAALADDIAGIAFAPLGDRNPAVKAVALSAEEHGTDHALDAQTVIERA